MEGSECFVYTWHGGGLVRLECGAGGETGMRLLGSAQTPQQQPTPPSYGAAPAPSAQPASLYTTSANGQTNPISGTYSIMIRYMYVYYLFLLSSNNFNDWTLDLLFLYLLVAILKLIFSLLICNDLYITVCIIFSI